MIIAIITAVVLAPYAWMVTTSFKESTKVMMFPPQWWPDPFVWDNYVDIFKKAAFHVFMFNSVYIAVIVTVATCFFAVLAGYAFAKIAFPFRNTLFLLMLSGMMIPAEVTVIPLFMSLSKLQLANSHFPLIVPTIFGSSGSFAVFLARQFFITIPDELLEAAKIDGCTPLRTFWEIMAPMAKSVTATIAILTFIHSWNDFFVPFIFLSKNSLYTIPIGMQLFATEAGTDWHLVMAAAVVSTLPLLIVFFTMQKQFIESLAMSGIK